MSTASSPPPSLLSSPITTTTTTAATTTSQTHHAAQPQSHGPPSQHNSQPPAQTIHATLPSAETQRDITLARNAVVASLGNMVDNELQSRASILHSNAAALDRQERDVVAATANLRREREKLGKEASAAAKKLKELGNVQNWAEVLEGKFLVLEETVRLANGGREYRGDDDESVSGSGSYCSCSCSECGDDDFDEREVVGKGKQNATIAEEVDGLKDQTAWSDTSRSFVEPESSSSGIGTAKGSDTTSVSTTS